MILLKFQHQIIVYRRHVEPFLESMVYNQSFHNFQKYLVGKCLNAIFLFNVDGFRSVESQWLFIQFVYHFFEVINVRLVDEDYFAVFKILEFVDIFVGLDKFIELSSVLLIVVPDKFIEFDHLGFIVFFNSTEQSLGRDRN